MTYYSIFKVYDYKGGELTSYVNLDYESFILEICDIIENDTDELIEYGMTKDEMVKALNKNEIEYDEYAGYDEGFCGELYEHRDGKLIEVSIEDYYDGVADHFVKYFKDNKNDYKEYWKTDKG